MRCKIVGITRHTMASKIGWRGDQDAAQLRDLLRPQADGAEISYANRNIEPMFDEINDSIIQYQVYTYFRKPIHECRCAWNHKFRRK